MAGAVRAANNPVALETRIVFGALALAIAYAGVIIAIASPASFYTLDDPYIHMALAENIARGHFGVNLGEVSNPSSSILWPWLMAAADRAGLLPWAPLLVNIACFGAGVRVAVDFVLARLSADGRGQAHALILTALGLFAFNLLGVVFTGMEHSLHALVTMLAVTRVIDAKYDRFTLALLALGPLVRFEGAIPLAFGVGAALVDRRGKFALATVVAAVIPAGLYAVWLTGLGLPPLPSSVLSKSVTTSGLVDGGGGALGGLLASLLKNVQSPAAPLLLAMGALLVWAAWTRTGRQRWLAAGLLAMLVLAMMLGRMDSYARYEVYLLCGLGLGLVHVFAKQLQAIAGERWRTLALGGAVCVLGALLGPYVLLSSPQAARNIDHQQHQMHRLAAECWRRPVAVNDLGWVSFRNDAYVLDLYGLGSEEARKARAARPAGWMQKLADKKGVDLAMIYADWFPDLPADWIYLGAIVDSERQVTPYANAVRVYATRPQAASAARSCLQWLAGSAPAGVAVAVRSRSPAWR